MKLLLAVSEGQSEEAAKHAIEIGRKQDRFDAKEIVGTALLMRVPTSFKILGYPGLAILFFLAAAAGGLARVLSIRVTDGRPRRQRGLR